MGRIDVRRRPRGVLTLCASVAVLGCGSSGTPVQTGVTSGFRTLHYPGAGISLRAPVNWSTTTGQGPLVATFTSGTSVVALWRFPRDAGRPGSSGALKRTRQMLISKARTRDPGMSLIRVNTIQIDGQPGVELDAIEHINGRRRRVRSTHVFEPRAEVVLDEYAPPEMFHSVDHAVFSPLKHSLLLSGASAA
jgi:hypothetical protein